MNEQKKRSKNAAALEKDDWVVLLADDEEEFTGYDFLSNEIKITRYREIRTKEKTLYQLIFNYTPFYAESGGQVGDKGVIENDNEKVSIVDTQKENDLIIHLSKSLPKDPSALFTARVNETERKQTASHHSATHLMHYALRKVLGEHVEQKGSLVHPKGLRFDFAHFQKVTDDEIREVERLVNQMIRENITIEEKRQIPISEAKKMGALALFGEKYGDMVRVIRFGDSMELCGGIHANATGQLGFFKITKESSVAAGIRRVEAVVGKEAENYIFKMNDTLTELSGNLEKHSNLVEAVKKVVSDNTEMSKQMATLKKNAIEAAMEGFKENVEKIGDINFLSAIMPLGDADLLRHAAFKLKNEIDNLFLVMGSADNQKALLVVMIADNLVSEKGLNASNIIREIAKEIQGGGGGQPFFATAGGKNPKGIASAIVKAKDIVRKI